MRETLDRAARFCARYGLGCPILLAPMAGACPASLSIAVANAGGMGAMGALLTPPDGIRAWVEEFRSKSAGPFQLNVWIPDPPARRDPDAEGRIRAFLARWGPEVPANAGDMRPPDFTGQCDAFLELKPTAVSSIMGLFPDAYVRRLKERGVAWFATVTTLAEAKAARDAGADAIVAQGIEAGAPRIVRRSGRRAAGCRSRRAAAAAGGLHRSADHRRRWDRRRPWRGRRIDARRERRVPRHGIPPLSRGRNAPAMGELARGSRAQIWEDARSLINPSASRDTSSAADR